MYARAMASKIAACLFLVLCVAPSSSCGGGDPVDVAGDFTIALTNRENGCDLANWEVDKTASNIPLTMAQDGADITGTVGGTSGGFLTLWLGSNVFHGTVDGDAIDMTIYGDRSESNGNCTYTINATVDATMDGDLMQGDIYYTAATNGNPDCETSGLEGCETRQEFNGTRPPQ